MTAKEPRPASHFRLVLQSTPTMQGPGQLTFPLSKPLGDVSGFLHEADVDPVDQEVADRVSVKLQAFYDGLPEDEQAVVVRIVANAAEHAWSQSD